MKLILLSMFLVALSQLPLPSAHAGYATLLAASQWQNVEDSDPFLQTPACRAFTRVSNSAEPVELSLSYPKDGKTLPLIGLRTKLAPTLVAVKISSKVSEYFFPLQAGATNEDPNLYWYAPINFVRLEKLVHDDTNLDLILDPKGTATPVRVSLKGSGDALDAAKKCLKKAKVEVPADFFKLLNGEKESFRPDLGDRSPALMFRNVQDAFQAFQLGQGISAELAKLRKANEPLLSKEKSALATVKKAQATHDTALNKLQTAQNLVDDLTLKLDQTKKELADLQAEKPRAEADLAAKKAIYDPLKQQMAPYEQRLAQAQSAVDQTSSEIETNENTIERNTRLIPQLERERAGLINDIPGFQRRVRSARDAYDAADRDYRNYDVRRETERFLSNDFNYTWAKRDLEDGRRELENAQRDLSSAQSRFFNAQSALNSCRANPQNNCSSQENEYNQAQSQVSQAQQMENIARSKISTAEWKIQMAEDDASRKANSESDRLRRIRDDASSEYDSAVAALRNAEDRIEEIRVAIPRLRDQIARAEAALPGLRSLLTQQQAELAARTREHDRFADSIGFPAAEAAYFAARNHLSEVNQGIANANKAIPRITKDLAAAQKVIPGLTKTYTKAQTDLAAAQAKLAPITEQLKGFRAQEKVQLDALAVEEGKFRTAKATYQELYLELTR